MEENLIERNKSEEEVNMMSPLVWAYIGDCVFEIFIRNHLVQTTKFKPHMLHIETIKYVKASAQAELLKKIQNILTDEEKQIVKRARNPLMKAAMRRFILRSFK